MFCAHLQCTEFKTTANQRFHLWLPSRRASSAQRNMMSRACSAHKSVMPSTYVSLHCHLVFSTKDREPWITPDWRDRLHGYLGGIVNGLGGIPLAIGGTENHVHLLVGFRSSHRVDYFLRDLKADSTAWVHREIYPQFSWQRGYAAFAVSPSDILNVKRYVVSQEEHHRRKTFQEEFVAMLNEQGIQYDKRYLW